MSAGEKELAAVKAALEAEGYQLDVAPDGVTIFDVRNGTGIVVQRERGTRVLQSLSKGRGLVGRAIGMALSFLGSD